MDLSDTIKEVIASALVDYSEIEIVKISHQNFPEDIIITNQLDDMTSVVIDGADANTRNVPMKISDESQEELVSNNRSLSIQGLNDVIAYYDDLAFDSDERITCEIILCLVDRDMNISNYQKPFKYYVLGIDFSQKSNSATLRIGTTPTNKNECGQMFNESNFPSIEGL